MHNFYSAPEAPSTSPHELARVAPAPPPGEATTGGLRVGLNELGKGHDPAAIVVMEVPAGTAHAPGAQEQRRKGKCKAHMSELLQQVRPGLQVPLYMYQLTTMRIMSGCCAVFFCFLGVLLIVSGSSAFEMRIDYGSGTVNEAFTVDPGLSGPVLLSYEVPDVLVNHRNFVSGKDSDLLAGLFITYSCEGATTEEDVRWRRPGDTYFQSLVGNSSDFKPCGLASLAMFTDEYELYDQTRAESVTLDETDLALPKDQRAFDSDILSVDNPGPYGPFFTIDNTPSWLLEGAFLEHFKVWYRSSASPSIRHLWARVADGLPAGTYELRFTRNSPVWTESWQAPTKRVVISQTSMFGNPGACTVMAWMCFSLCFVQAVFLLFFLCAPVPK